MGKYTHMKGVVPQLPDQEPTARRLKLNDLKKGFRGNSSAELAHTYARLKAEKNEAEGRLKEVQIMLDACGELIQDKYEEDNLESQRTSAGVLVSTGVMPHAVVKDRDVFREWCIEEGLMRSLTLPWQTTNEMVKTRLVNGEDCPPGVEAYLRPTIRVSGLKKQG